MLEKSITMLWNLSKKRNKAQFLQLLQQSNIQNNLTSLTPKQISLLIYSISHLSLNDTKLWLDLSKVFKSKAVDMNPQDLTNCTWGFTRQRIGLFRLDDNLWSIIEKLLILQLPKLNHYELVSVYHSLALISEELSKGDVNLNSLIEARISKILKYLDLSSLSICAFAINKRGATANPLWKPIESSFLHKFQNQNTIDSDMEVLASLAFSFSKAGKGSEIFWNTIQRSLYTNTSFDSINPRALANMCWALAKSERGNDELFWSQTIKHFSQNLSSYNIVDFVHISWALNKLGRINDTVITAMVTYFTDHVTNNQKLKQQDVLNLSWIFHKNGVNLQRIWDILVLNFEENLRDAYKKESKEDIFQDFLFKSHIVLFNKDKKRLWMEAAERFYIKYMDKLEFSNERIQIENFIEILYFAQINEMGSELFWSVATSKLKIFQEKGLEKGTQGLVTVKYFLLTTEPKFQSKAQNVGLKPLLLDSLALPANLSFFIWNLPPFKNIDQGFLDLVSETVKKEPWLKAMLVYLKSEPGEVAKIITHFPQKIILSKSKIELLTEKYLSFDENQQTQALRLILDGYCNKLQKDSCSLEILH